MSSILHSDAIWFLKMDFRGVWPPCWRTFWFSNSVPWRRVLRTITWGTHPADERGCEALSSMRTPEIPQKSSEIYDMKMNQRNHQKSMILKMKQDTYGKFLRYQESPGMTFDSTRRHKTWFQEVWFSQKCQDFEKIVADLTHQRSDSGPEVDTVGICVENDYSRNRECFIWIRRFEFVIWISESPGLLTGGPSDFQIMSPGGKCFATWISEGSGPTTGGPSDFQIMSPGGECFAPLGALILRMKRGAKHSPHLRT